MAEQTRMDQAFEAYKALLGLVGDKSECKKCGATIFWVTTKRGAKHPWDPAGVSHFATCLYADEFRKRK